MIKRVHIFYSGTVQGVGFRYSTQEYATSLNLKGWVKNLVDGRVEILAEGRNEDIHSLCEKLDNLFKGYIRGKEITLKQSSEKLTNFEITY